MGITIKKLSINDYEVIEKQSDRTSVVNKISLQDEILELKEKREKIEKNVLEKEELLKEILKIK